MIDLAAKGISARLEAHGLRATRQRRVIADLLFAGADRHVDAAMLHAEAAQAGRRLSMATVYNALHDFERAGLIRRVAVASERIWYDTDTGAHRHFFIEAENRILDMPDDGRIAPPPGYRIRLVDTVVHLERVGDDG
jgi:Fur family iron response transcriptional regulator